MCWTLEKDFCFAKIFPVSSYPASSLQSGTSGTPGSLDMTGGEYKTWERIHRGISDPRLLAIPTS
ncbi:hypothetical protein CL630_01680 [bacterium]|nr:hypothetical protein [bacterium]